MISDIGGTETETILPLMIAAFVLGGGWRTALSW